MPVTAVCPTCQTPYRLADSMRGKKVRCKQCQGVVPVPESADDGPAASHAVRPGQAPDPHVAAGPTRTAPRRRRDEGEEGDGGPRRSALPWIIGGSVGGLALIGIIIVIIVVAGGKEEPKPPVGQLPNFPGNPPGFPKEFPKGPIDKKVFPPPDVPNPNPGVLQAPAAKFLVGAKASDIKDIFFAPQAGRVGYLMWDTGGDFKKFVEVYDINAGNQVCRVDTVGDGDLLDLSPDASRLVKMENRLIHVWSLPDGKPLYTKWNPYEGEEKKPVMQRRELVWCSLLDRDRLVTAARNGAFEVWNLAEKRLIAAIPPPKQMVFVGTDSFSRRAKNIAISPDRRILAVTNKDGYNLFEAATGKFLRATATLAQEGSVGNEWSVGFNPDATQLAARLNLQRQGGKPSERVLLYDVGTGQLLKNFEIKQDFQTNGPLTWWGPDHLILWGGNVFNGRLMRLADGRALRGISHTSTGRFAPSIHNEMLWYPDSVGPTSRALLVGVRLPVNDLSRPVPDGPSLPNWRFSHEGIALRR